MNRPVFRTLAAAGCSIVLATAFAGCGSDSKKTDTPTSSATTLTAAQFKDQANAICKAQDSAESETFTRAQTAYQSGDTAGAEAAAKEGVTVIRGEADAIKALKPPKELSADVSALVTSLNSALDAIESQGIAAIGGLADASTKANALGLKECGN